jgi:hypothetical protein
VTPPNANFFCLSVDTRATWNAGTFFPSLFFKNSRAKLSHFVRDVISNALAFSSNVPSVHHGQADSMQLEMFNFFLIFDFLIFDLKCIFSVCCRRPLKSQGSVRCQVLSLPTCPISFLNSALKSANFQNQVKKNQNAMNYCPLTCFRFFLFLIISL